jgi:hypothetical protein
MMLKDMRKYEEVEACRCSLSMALKMKFKSFIVNACFQLPYFGIQQKAARSIKNCEK